MKKKIGLFLNLIIIVLEVIGLYLSVGMLKEQLFLYYTQDSNIFLLIASLLYVINYNKDNKKYVSLLKYGATLSVMVTFIVVILVLGPMTNLTYKWLLFDSANLYFHTLCPLLALAAFLFFDDLDIKGNTDSLWAMGFTFAYSVVIIILNLIKVVDGPYPFLHLYSNPIYVSIMWFIILECGTFALAKILEIGKNKIQTK